jgi:hypothetical protein
MNKKGIKIISGLMLMVLSAVLISACSSDDDDVDFSGIYDVSIVENIVWGNASGPLTRTGVLGIKVAGSQATVEGILSTTGEIVGNTLYLKGTTEQSGGEYITTTFDPATLTGNVLRFNTHQSGKLKSNGVLFPFSSNAQFTCIKR